MNAAAAVYAVDDDEFTRTLLEQVFSSADIPVATYASAQEFLDVYSPANAGCLILDMIMPGMNGLQLQQALTERGNETPIIFLTAAEEISTAVSALKAGAVDFIEKPIVPEKLVDCVGKAIELDKQLRFKRMQLAEIDHRLASLTRREAEVMKWIVRGKSNKLVARILNISTRTVEVHRSNVLSKMQAESLAELVQMVMHTGITEQSA